VSTRPAVPTFSLISAVYEVARYLPEFLTSVERLRGGLADVELVFVSDGSPDESEQIIEDWIRRTGAPARLLRKENGGPGSARNHGLDAATGTWVSFPDPDDVLDEDYLDAVRRFLATTEQADTPVSAVAARVLQFTEDPMAARDDHLLAYRYAGGDRAVRLDEEPRYFHTHVASGFYRRSVVESRGLRFDPRLRVAFDDAAFAAAYLLAHDHPVLGVVPGARYRYRKRADGSSVVGRMWTRPAKYTEVPQHGYLHLLRLRPVAPRWLQNLVLYDLQWYFFEHEQPDSPNARLAPELNAAFLDLLDQVLELVDEEALLAYSLHSTALHHRTAWLARKTGRLVRPEARVVERDPTTRRVRLSYHCSTGDPDERITVDGVRRHPVEASTRPLEYYGATFLHQRDVLVEADGALVVEVDGEVLPLTERSSGCGVLFPWEWPPPPSA
jgi:glycosyltransferase involved in cell wall biosynthesis